MSEIDTELLKMLACPMAHVPLVEVEGWLYSTDAKTRRRYPIRDGIPVLLVDESEEVSQAEFERVMDLAKGEA
jgi:uncharacterized protein YbaR (Trm112 family)